MIKRKYMDNKNIKTELDKQKDIEKEIEKERNKIDKIIENAIK